jgi:hypothetical protein
MFRLRALNESHLRNVPHSSSAIFHHRHRHRGLPILLVEQRRHPRPRAREVVERLDVHRPHPSVQTARAPRRHTSHPHRTSVRLTVHLENWHGRVLRWRSESWLLCVHKRTHYHFCAISLLTTDKSYERMAPVAGSVLHGPSGFAGVRNAA